MEVYAYGGAGGSAYADIDGTIKKVTITGGYCGQELKTESNLLRGNYGNGEVKITKL